MRDPRDDNMIVLPNFPDFYFYLDYIKKKTEISEKKQNEFCLKNGPSKIFDT